MKRISNGSGEVLDLRRLLGFNQVAAFAQSEEALARALGANCNKIGEIPKQHVDVNAVPLDSASG